MSEQLRLTGVAAKRLAVGYTLHEAAIR